MHFREAPWLSRKLVDREAQIRDGNENRGTEEAARIEADSMRRKR